MVWHILICLSVVDEFVEYFLYNEKGVSGTTSGTGIKIAPDTIAFCPSGFNRSK